ncbi:MAG: glycosyltransferase family 4 protein [Gammaproteobacteria bacterium]|nr:glycosyltransferase family 4 protein [Gammaproteobacteria bacterium]
MDHPNERSLHLIPLPRAGGVAILAAFFTGIILLIPLLGVTLHPVLLLCTLIIAVISFLDDCYSLSAGLRFIIHVCTAVLLVMNGFALEVLELPGLSWQWPAFVAVFVSACFIVWLINLYNFMDGMDGFAAGMAMIGFSCFALLGWNAGHLLFISANLILVASVAGFLLFNFPPAKIFMGDSGSSTLGFLVAAYSLWASAEGIFPVWVGLLVFSPFIVDASVTLMRRIVARERVWEAHKRHFYQRLVQAGWGHKKTVLCAYLLMASCSATAWLAMQVDVAFQWMIAIGWVVVYIMIMTGVVKLARQYASNYVE